MIDIWLLNSAIGKVAAKRQVTPYSEQTGADPCQESNFWAGKRQVTSYSEQTGADRWKKSNFWCDLANLPDRRVVWELYQFPSSFTRSYAGVISCWGVSREEHVVCLAFSSLMLSFPVVWRYHKLQKKGLLQTMLNCMFHFYLNRTLFWIQRKLAIYSGTSDPELRLASDRTTYKFLYLH